MSSDGTKADIMENEAAAAADDDGTDDDVDDSDGNGGGGTGSRNDCRSATVDSFDGEFAVDDSDAVDDDDDGV
jgi:hypothetical protein